MIPPCALNNDNIQFCFKRIKMMSWNFSFIFISKIFSSQSKHLKCSASVIKCIKSQLHIDQFSLYVNVAWQELLPFSKPGVPGCDRQYVNIIEDGEIRGCFLILKGGLREIEGGFRDNNTQSVDLHTNVTIISTYMYIRTYCLHRSANRQSQAWGLSSSY